jgi:hypothetical protein
MLLALFIFAAVLIIAAALFAVWPYLIILGLVALAFGLLFTYPLAVVGLIAAVLIVGWVLEYRRISRIGKVG